MAYLAGVVVADLKSREYLEKLFADSYKRELDQEENIYRSLPFFIAGLALSMTALSLSAQILFPSWGFYFSGGAWYALLLHAIVMATLVFCSVITMAFVFINLFIAIRPCTYIQPPAENELLAWAQDTRDYYAHTEGLSGDALDAAVLADVRDFMASEFAKAANRSRMLNARKQFARSQAANYLMWALVAAFVVLMCAVVYRGNYELRTHVAGESHGSQHPVSHVGERDAAAADGQTAAPAQPIPDSRGQAAVGR